MWNWSYKGEDVNHFLYVCPEDYSDIFVDNLFWKCIVIIHCQSSNVICVFFDVPLFKSIDFVKSDWEKASRLFIFYGIFNHLDTSWVLACHEL